MSKCRPFDYLYDPIYEISDKKQLPTLPADIFFKDYPKEILEQFKCFPREPRKLPFQRLRGGGNIITYRKYQEIDCSKIRKDCVSLKSKNFPEVIEIVFPEKPCVQVSKKPSPRIKQKQMQTIYRKEAVLTQMFIPPVLETGAENLEVNTVAAFINPDDLIGMFEVRTIERARRRLEYENCLKTVMTGKESAKAMILLEAFEWEEWIAREEDIANCQNLRMEIMIEMFFKREEKTQTNHEKRFKLGVEKISREANKAFEKRQIEYLRAKRRLDAKYTGQRKYAPTSKLEQFTNKASEFYGPIIRHGSNPNRSHFQPKLIKFNERIDALNVKINFEKTKCEYRKFKDIRVPKGLCPKLKLSEKMLDELQEGCKVGFCYTHSHFTYCG